MRPHVIQIEAQFASGEPLSLFYFTSSPGERTLQNRVRPRPLDDADTVIIGNCDVASNHI